MRFGSATGGVLVALLVLLLLLVAATGLAQPDHGFTVEITILPTHVTVATDGLVHANGSTARELRACLDATTETERPCPGLGNGDGTVQEVEADDYERWMLPRLNRDNGTADGDGGCEFDAGHGVRIDGHARSPPCSNVVRRWNLRDAEGPVASDEAILLDHTVVMYYPRTELQSSVHPVEVRRKDDAPGGDAPHVLRVVPGGSWRLDAGSIQPAWAAERRVGNALVFTDADDLGGEAVRFNVTGPGDEGPAGPGNAGTDQNAPAVGWGIAVVAVTMALGWRRGAGRPRR